MTAPGTAREEHQSMEFSVTKSALLNELSTTQGVVERKTTIPILSNLLVEAKGSQLTITATDLELSIRTSCEAKIKKEGAGTIPAKKLLELVRLLPEGEIKFKLLENHWVEIVSEKKKYKLVGMAKENFPALPAMPHVMVKIPTATLESLIGKTKFAISMEESRYTLNGGLLILKPDTAFHNSPISALTPSNFPSQTKASKFLLPAPNTAKPRKISTRNTRATPSPSASIPATCWIFSPPPRKAPSASN